MIDGPGRVALKWLVRAWWTFEASLHRGLRRLAGRQRYRLGGQCQACARCCEAPSIQVGRLLWFLPTPRRLFLAWQRGVNGFDFVRGEADGRVLVFRCQHFDPATRRCDSYRSRPFMCRDYPRLLLEQPWPEFFDGCGHHAVARHRDGLRAALERTALTDEAKARLGKKLHIVD